MKFYNFSHIIFTLLSDTFQNFLVRDLQITDGRAYITENCVSKGMCADFSIHDTDGHNPHAYILLTVRPLNDKGK